METSKKKNSSNHRPTGGAELLISTVFWLVMIDWLVRMIGSERSTGGREELGLLLGAGVWLVLIGLPG